MIQLTNRRRRVVLAIGPCFAMFAFFEIFMFGEYQPRYWSDLVNQLERSGTIAILAAFLVLLALLAGIAALGLQLLLTFVVPLPPMARATLQTVGFTAIVFSMTIAVRVVAPSLVSSARAIFGEAPLP